MKTTSSRIVPVWVCLGLLVLVQAVVTVHGALYSETFDNATTGNLKTSAIGWSVYAGSTTLNLSSTNTLGTPVNDYAGVSPTGFIFMNNAATANQIFALVHTFETSLTINSGDTFSWQMGNGTKASTAQLMIQVDGSWYVSTSVKQNSNAYALNMIHTLMGFSVVYQLGIAAWLWHIGWASYLVWHLCALIPVSVVLYVLWMRIERSIRGDVARGKAEKKPLDGIPHHGVFFLKACALLLLLTV